MFKPWQRLNNANLVRFLLLFSCSWAMILLINYFYGMIALFTGAGIFAALLNYPVAWLSRYLPRGLAITIAFISTLVLLIAMISLLGFEVINQGQGLVGQLHQKLDQPEFVPFQNFLERLDIDKIISTLQAGLASGLGIVQQAFSGVFSGVFAAVIGLYMLIDGEKIWRLFLDLIPAEYRDRFAQTFQQSFLGFLRGQLILMLFLSISTFIILSVLGVNYALILALIVGTLDAVPGIGATLGVVVIALLVFLSQGGDLTIKVVIASIVLQQIQDNFLHPKVMSNALELNPVLLFLALFIGERVAGLLGVFLAIPIAGMIAAWIRLVNADQENDLPENPEAMIEASNSMD